MFLFCKVKKIKRNSQSGFTLIELMVTIGIIILMTAVLMQRYSSFNNVVILKSQAYELALDVREAQVFGVSTRGTSNSYREAFGISFDLTQTNNAYKLFQDASGDLKYDTD